MECIRRYHASHDVSFIFVGLCGLDRPLLLSGSDKSGGTLDMQHHIKASAQVLK